MEKKYVLRTKSGEAKAYLGEGCAAYIRENVGGVTRPHKATGETK